jgi:hypothetical protein
MVALQILYWILPEEHLIQAMFRELISLPSSGYYSVGILVSVLAYYSKGTGLDFRYLH